MVLGELALRCRVPEQLLPYKGASCTTCHAHTSPPCTRSDDTTTVEISGTSVSSTCSSTARGPDCDLVYSQASTSGREQGLLLGSKPYREYYGHAEDVLDLSWSKVGSAAGNISVTLGWCWCGGWAWC